MALILVVEDEYLLADMLAGFLQDEGHDVATAAHGVAALKLLQERKPDLLISDYMMPLMNGAELAEAIRSDPRFSGLPVLLMTGAQGSSRTVPA